VAWFWAGARVVRVPRRVRLGPRARARWLAFRAGSRSVWVRAGRSGARSVAVAWFVSAACAGALAGAWAAVVGRSVVVRRLGFGWAVSCPVAF
jgi:hypothetical protein